MKKVANEENEMILQPYETILLQFYIKKFDIEGNIIHEECYLLDFLYQYKYIF